MTFWWVLLLWGVLAVVVFGLLGYRVREEWLRTDRDVAEQDHQYPRSDSDA